MRRISLALLIAFTTLLAGCEKPFDPSKLTAGNELYAYYCMECHKRSGVGEHLENLPAKDTPLKDYEIVLIVKYGYNKSHAMPTFENLSAEQADAIATYLITQRQLRGE